jgi:hypothetical protein
MLEQYCKVRPPVRSFVGEVLDQAVPFSGIVYNWQTGTILRDYLQLAKRDNSTCILSMVPFSGRCEWIMLEQYCKVTPNQNLLHYSGFLN